MIDVKCVHDEDIHRGRKSMLSRGGHSGNVSGSIYVLGTVVMCVGGECC